MLTGFEIAGLIKSGVCALAIFDKANMTDGAGAGICCTFCCTFTGFSRAYPTGFGGEAGLAT
ncbi:hypothetical protein K443DRAFT_679968 [Laccaria amethystina LaAM-08-1]|uniref:Uncharacterized protein n=1 Tax=Laccaria amethystina LaAM-08-1 TaxID=1095629 RepID=A0A0C9XCQ4_9AGAR|nr:hypothetical protein K443DRAFT_679968 [Laccaria amethystina LaAM-08-1]